MRAFHTDLIRGRAIASWVALLATILGVSLAYAQPENAPDNDPNLKNPTSIVTIPLSGYTIAGLVTHLPGTKTFNHGVALFTGHPGILKLKEENGQVQLEMKGNFLVRTRRHWLDDETLVVLVDAPSDQWATFTQGFRESARYGADVKALLNEVGRRYHVKNWTLVGTSEGSVSAFHVARMNPQLAQRVILSSSLFLATRHGPGLSGVKWNNPPAGLLWVHHENDPCQYTSYRDAKRYAEKSHSPLVTIRGGGPDRGHPCEARSAHGFIGVELEAIAAMRSWVKTGNVPSDIAR